MIDRLDTQDGPDDRALSPAITVTIPDEAVERFAAALLPALYRRLAPESSPDRGYLNVGAAAEYLCVSRKRIYDLKCSGALIPDGYDGRTPLWRRETLDAYVAGRRVR